VKLNYLIATILVTWLILPAGVGAAERARADVECMPTDQKFVYDCLILLTAKNSGTAMDDVEFTVNAEMPSMPMAHNVRPVKAMPVGKPGMYRARIELQMYGEWVLKMEISSPARDRIIHKMHFGAAKVESDSPGMKHEMR
jgi:hypothetical protein